MTFLINRKLTYRFDVCVFHTAASSDLRVIINTVNTRNLALAKASHLLYLIRVTGVLVCIPAVNRTEAEKHSIQVHRSPVTIIGPTHTRTQTHTHPVVN